MPLLSFVSPWPFFPSPPSREVLFWGERKRPQNKGWDSTVPWLSVLTYSESGSFPGELSSKYRQAIRFWCSIALEVVHVPTPPQKMIKGGHNRWDNVCMCLCLSLAQTYHLWKRGWKQVVRSFMKGMIDAGLALLSVSSGSVPDAWALGRTWTSATSGGRFSLSCKPLDFINSK